MAAVAQRLASLGIPMREFPQSVSNLTAMGSNLFELIKGRGIETYSDDQIRLAVSRAIAVETPRGWRIAKEKASHKIDVVVALAMASLAAVQDGDRLKVPVVGAVLVGQPRAPIPGSDFGLPVMYGAPTGTSRSIHFHPAAPLARRDEPWESFVPRYLT
jgi:hypothetical protein